MEKKMAKAIVDLVDHHTRRLIAMLRIVEKNGTEEERQAYVRGLGQVLGNMYEGLDLIYREHPELEPEQLRRVDLPPIDDPIAVRELWTRDAQGNKASLPVLLAAPVRNARAGQYECRYEIRGLGMRPDRCFGNDAMSALTSAIDAIAKDLRRAREKGEKIWRGDEDDTLYDLGFHSLPSAPGGREHDPEKRPMSEDISKDVAAVAEEYARKLREIRETLRKELPAEELDRYAEGIAEVLEHLDGDILAPIYRAHPHLRPRPEPAG